jgi:Arc/MetJ family transcription regulator
MRTNIVIDDNLIARAMRLSGAATKREAVQRGLELLVRLKQQEKIRSLRGKLHWEGNLDEMRRDFPAKRGR